MKVDWLKEKGSSTYRYLIRYNWLYAIGVPLALLLVFMNLFIFNRTNTLQLAMINAAPLSDFIPFFIFFLLASFFAGHYVAVPHRKKIKNIWWSLVGFIPTGLLAYTVCRLIVPYALADGYLTHKDLVLSYFRIDSRLWVNYLLLGGLLLVGAILYWLGQLHKRSWVLQNKHAKLDKFFSYTGVYLFDRTSCYCWDEKKQEYILHRISD